MTTTAEVPPEVYFRPIHDESPRADARRAVDHHLQALFPLAERIFEQAKVPTRFVYRGETGYEDYHRHLEITGISGKTHFLIQELTGRNGSTPTLRTAEIWTQGPKHIPGDIWRVRKAPTAQNDGVSVRNKENEYPGHFNTDNALCEVRQDFEAWLEERTRNDISSQVQLKISQVNAIMQRYFGSFEKWRKTLE